MAQKKDATSDGNEIEREEDTRFRFPYEIPQCECPAKSECVYQGYSDCIYEYLPLFPP